MASQVEIVNRALTKLGAARITSLTQNSKSASCMSSLYDTVRRSELRKQNWSFAIKRASLAALAATPDWGPALKYQLPTDYLRIIQVNDIFISPSMYDYINSDTSPFFIEGNELLTDYTAPLKIRYVRDITDPAALDALFVESFASKLAYEGCEEITQSTSKKQIAADDYKAAMHAAAASNAIERAPQGIADDSWILGRV